MVNFFIEVVWLLWVFKKLFGKKSHFFTHFVVFQSDQWVWGTCFESWLFYFIFVFFLFPTKCRTQGLLNLRSPAGLVPHFVVLLFCSSDLSGQYMISWVVGFNHQYKAHWNFRNVMAKPPEISPQSLCRWLVEKSVCAPPACGTFIFLFLFLPSYCQWDVIYSFYGNSVCWMQFPGRKLHGEMGEEVIIIAIICISPCW